ncbi:type II toxin-antitoxin system RelE/ParE family toxin [Rhodopila sp.]|uniref:type II toxin-antitoxin system RelE/ParE family toxin n=1 Tax=Rhodopila sp. TaxID=2480087 RepID=UPI003D0DEF86
MWPPNPPEDAPASKSGGNIRDTRPGSHVLFYSVADEAIEIVRILHGRMDFKRHMP